MTQKVNKQNTNGFRITSVRWYWWLLILVIIYFIYSGICTTFGLNYGDGLLNAASRALLGFVRGLKNVVTDSWWFILGISIYAFSYATPAVIAWLGHFGKGKSEAQQNKDMGVNKEGLERLIDEKREELDQLSFNEQVELVKLEANTIVTNDSLTRLHERYHEQYIQASESSRPAIAEEYYEAVEGVNEAQERSGGEPQPFLPIEEAP